MDRMNLRQMDVRVVERYISKGKITRDEYKQALSDLPDLESEAEEVDYEGLLQKDEPAPVITQTLPGHGTPILTRGSAAGPLPPLPVSR